MLSHAKVQVYRSRGVDLRSQSQTVKYGILPINLPVTGEFISLRDSTILTMTSRPTSHDN